MEAAEIIYRSNRPNKPPPLPGSMLYHRRSLRAKTTTKRSHAVQLSKVISKIGFRHPVALVTPYAVHHVISVLLFLLSTTTLNTYQQANYCPKPACTCDEQNLEIHCGGSLGGISGLPLTLNPNTERLSINYAQTSQLSGVDSMDKLKVLDLAHNKLTLIDFSDITGHKMLTFFNSSHNSISDLKDSLVSKSLAELDLSAHNLDKSNDLVESELRKKLAKINVAQFDLSYNSLTILKNLTFVRWHKLQHLNLSHNQISNLESHSLFGLTSLETINLRANRLTQLPSTAFQSTIRSIFRTTRPSSAEQSPLRYLDLSENTFVYVGSEAFRRLGKVQAIYLESCSIQSISEHAFEDLVFLQALSLSSNSLQTVPGNSFGDLSALRVLNLNHNNISSIEVGIFSDLVSLQELQLSGGSFREIEAGAFTGLENLQKLKISHNPNLVTVRPGAMKNLARLTLLDLQSNSLPHIPAEVNHESLALIDLRGNPLECGCALRWLTTWLRRFNESLQFETSDSRTVLVREHFEASTDPLSISRLVNQTCSGPPALAGQPVIDLPISKLECLEPSSELHVQIGYATLFAISTVLIVVCMINWIQNKKQLLTMLKKNLVQSHMPVTSPYTINSHKNPDNLKKETQLYSSDYENIDYGPQAQIYSFQGDQVMYYGVQQPQYPNQI